ncbi:MAG: YidB family protein [Cyanobacteriota bacterium]
MALLDAVLSRISSSLGSEQTQTLLQGVINQAGGLQGLAKRFNTTGMAEVFNSWVAIGENIAIKPEQLDAVFDNEMVQQLAGKLGLDPEKARSVLAQLLPKAVDELTPAGTLEDAAP